MSSYSPVLRLDTKLNSPESLVNQTTLCYYCKKKLLSKDIDIPTQFIPTTKYKIDNQQGPTV